MTVKLACLKQGLEVETKAWMRTNAPGQSVHFVQKVIKTNQFPAWVWILCIASSPMCYAVEEHVKQLLVAWAWLHVRMTGLKACSMVHWVGHTKSTLSHGSRCAVGLHTSILQTSCTVCKPHVCSSPLSLPHDSHGCQLCDSWGGVNCNEIDMRRMWEDGETGISQWFCTVSKCWSCKIHCELHWFSTGWLPLTVVQLTEQVECTGFGWSDHMCVLESCQNLPFWLHWQSCDFDASMWLVPLGNVLHGVSVHCLPEGLLCSDRLCSNQRPFHWKLSTHNAAVAQHHNALS